LSGLEGNLALAGVTGFLGAFLAFQVWYTVFMATFQGEKCIVINAS